jgi:hypothetical protein
MGPLLAAVFTAASLLLVVRRARSLPLLEAAVLVIGFGLAGITFVEGHDPAFARPGAALVGVFAVLGAVALPLLALLLLLEHHLHVRRALGELAEGNARMQDAVARLAEELRALRDQRAAGMRTDSSPAERGPRTAPRSGGGIDDHDYDDRDRDRWRRDEVAD